MIADTAHFLTALDLFSKHQLSILPVLNEQQECIGMIPQKSLNDALAKFLGVDVPGAIIVLICCTIPIFIGRNVKIGGI